jgi:hypothetical protein
MKEQEIAIIRIGNPSSAVLVLSLKTHPESLKYTPALVFKQVKMLAL